MLFHMAKLKKLLFVGSCVIRKNADKLGNIDIDTVHLRIYIVSQISIC